MSTISKTVTNGWNKKGIHQIEALYYRLSSNVITKEWNIEDEIQMDKAYVLVEFDGDERIVSLCFADCEDEAFRGMKDSIREAKDKASMDYASRYNRYLFHVEFNVDAEVSIGPDVCVSKHQCYVDEDENRIIFICKSK